jgi:hypothetical protein
LYAAEETFTSKLLSKPLKNAFNGTVRAAGWAGAAVGEDADNFYDFSGPTILLMLYTNTTMNFDTINGAFANISRTATDWARISGNQTFSNPAIGEVMYYATCIRINWPWIAFPAILAFLTLIFFVTVAVNANMEQTPIWKLSH